MRSAKFTTLQAETKPATKSTNRAQVGILWLHHYYFHLEFFNQLLAPFRTTRVK